MIEDCIPFRDVPGSTALFLDFIERKRETLERFYPGVAGEYQWLKTPLPADRADIQAVARLLEEQNRAWGAGEATLKNIAALAGGSRAVVTGQQVTLFGGPLLTMMKAATAIARAREATAAGVPTVPVFWMATEDHDFAEVNTVSLPGEHGIHELHLKGAPPAHAPVGAWVPDGDFIEQVNACAALLGEAAQPEFVIECLRDAYAPRRSLAEMFARLMLRLFRGDGLILMDASTRAWHALGAPVLRRAIEDADTLHESLEARDAALAEAKYHSQVLVAPDSSTLFYVNDDGARTALHRADNGNFKAGKTTLSSGDLLRVLKDAPERLSPNALLRPVFQDFLLPTLAYIAGPAEIAYFAQSDVLFQQILGRPASVLPRLSATLLMPPVRRALSKSNLSVRQSWSTPQDIVLMLGLDTLSEKAKQQLSRTSAALESEIAALDTYATAADEALAHSARVAASKMRYQMDRIRKLFARHSAEREPALRRRARLISDMLYPHGHLQERVLSGLWFVAEAGEGLAATLVSQAEGRACNAHHVIPL